MNKPLCVSFIFGKNLGGKNNEQGKIRVAVNPSMIQDSCLSESGFGWWCHLHINVCLFCYHCSTGTVSVRTSKSPLWLTSVCELSTASFLLWPFLLWLFFLSWLLHSHRLQLPGDFRSNNASTLCCTLVTSQHAPHSLGYYSPSPHSWLPQQTNLELIFIHPSALAAFQ